ncbi:hypothetical protein SLA2020_281520 [Shorea laevis]
MYGCSHPRIHSFKCFQKACFWRIRDSHILSFQNSSALPANPKQFYSTLDSSLELKAEDGSLISRGSVENPKPSHGNKRTYTMTRTPPNAQDHIIAEGKRREKLSQRFIALFAIVPGLEKECRKKKCYLTPFVS